MGLSDWLGPAVGAVAVVVAAWLGLRGARTNDRTTGLDKAAQWWEKAVERLQSDVDHLKADRAAVKAEYAELKAEYAEVKDQAEQLSTDFLLLKESNEALAQENRLFREVLIGVLSRLQELVPETGRPIIEYIIERIPGLGRDKNA